jgi:hypothetical protein
MLALDNNRMSKRKSEEGTQFVRYVGPLLDALCKLGGSGTPDEGVERITIDFAISDEVQNELLASGELRFRNRVAWTRFYLVCEERNDSSKRGVRSLAEGHKNGVRNHIVAFDLAGGGRSAESAVGPARPIAQAQSAPVKVFRTVGCYGEGAPAASWSANGGGGLLLRP